VYSMTRAGTTVLIISKSGNNTVAELRYGGSFNNGVYEGGTVESRETLAGGRVSVSPLPLYISFKRDTGSLTVFGNSASTPPDTTITAAEIYVKGGSRDYKIKFATLTGTHTITGG